MSYEPGTNHCSAAVFDGHLANDDTNGSDFSDMVDWGSLGLDLLGGDLPGPERHLMKDPTVTHVISSADLHETQNGYVSELDISNVEADGNSPRPPSGNDTINMNDPETLATYTSLVLFANNPSAQRTELEACDYSHQATIRTLAMKLNLQCSSRVPGMAATTVYLQKYSYGDPVVGLERQISSTSGVSSDPVLARTESLMRGSTNSQLSHIDETHGSPVTHIPISDQHLGKNHNLDLPSHNAHLNHGNHGAFAAESRLGGTEYVPLLSCVVPPALPPSLYRLSSDHDSILSIPTSVESHSWRESFPALARTLRVIGACWRCKILRKKCDPDEPCKACPRAENKSRWQNIGCKRGTLLVHCPHVCLCPKTMTLGDQEVGQGVAASSSCNQTRQGARIHLQDAFDRLESILDSADDTYMNVVLDILCSPIVDLNVMRLPREHNLGSNLLVIAWTLVDSPSVKAILQVEHTHLAIEVIKAAIIYESEYGHISNPDYSCEVGELKAVLIQHFYVLHWLAQSYVEGVNNVVSASFPLPPRQLQERSESTLSKCLLPIIYSHPQQH